MTDGSSRQSVRRRRFLGLVAGGAAGGLAGCSAITEDGSTEDLKNSSSVIGHRFAFDPENYQLNPWSFGYRPGFPSMIFEYPSVTVHGEGRELTDLVTDVSVEGRTATVAYSDAFSWWNGDAVTARDRWVAHRIDDLLGVQTPWQNVDLLDEYTIEYTFESPLRRELVLDTVVGFLLDSPSWLFDEWRERLAGATTEDELESVATDLQNTSITPKAAEERGYGCGPYRIADVSLNKIEFERFDDHPNADAISVERAWFPIAEGRRYDELVGEGTLDIGEGFPGGRPDADVPDYIEDLASYRTDFGTRLSINWLVTHFTRRNVRRAVLCALPLEALVDAGHWGEPTTVQTGLSAGPEERWLGDLREQLYEYPVARDVERTHEFLRRAGYEQQGDGWVGPDGRRLEITLRGPRWDQWSLVVQQAGDALREAGFDVTVNSANVTSFGTQVETNNHQLAVLWTEGDPFHAYDVGDDSMFGFGYGVDDPDLDRSPSGKPVEPTIPADPGSLTVDGDGVTINVVELWQELRGPTSAERAAEIVRLLARWWNYDLPDLHLSTWRKRVWGNTRDFDWPSAGDDVYREAGPQNRVDFNLLRSGAVRPAE